MPALSAHRALDIAWAQGANDCLLQRPQIVLCHDRIESGNGPLYLDAISRMFSLLQAEFSMIDTTNV